MSFTLRPYQQQGVDRAVAYLTDPKKKGRHGLIVAPTGSGKSLYVANIARALDGPCIVFQPSREILKQNAGKLTAYGYPPALFSASVGRRQVGDITLATIGSVIHHADDFKDFRYVLIDEAHLVSAKGGMYREFLQVLEHARVLGLTATPYRLHSNSLGSQLRFLTRTRPRIFRDVVHVTQIGDLVRDGFLAHLTYRETPFDTSRLAYNTTGADYTDHSVQRYFREIGFSGELQRTVEGLRAEGRKHVLVFTRFVNEAEELAAVIPGAASVSGETPDRERARLLEDFKSGRIPVMCNVGVCAVGFDFPALDTVVLARPTVSLALYYQMVGRAIRTAPGKADALVVDMVGLVRQFGKVEDLQLVPAGPKGEQWVVRSHGRDLTNVYYGQRDGRQTAEARGYGRPRPAYGRTPWQTQYPTRHEGGRLF